MKVLKTFEEFDIDKLFPDWDKISKEIGIPVEVWDNKQSYYTGGEFYDNLKDLLLYGIIKLSDHDLIKKIVNLKPGEKVKGIKRALTYEQACRASEAEQKIKKYVEGNYPEYPYIKTLGVTHLKKVTTLAKRNKDMKLLDLIDLLSKVNLPENEEAEKYNI